MILVTGGTGLVGSHLLFDLTKNDHNIRALYRSTDTINKVRKVFSYYTDMIETQFKKIEWIKADLNDLPKLEGAFRGITKVFHCAALISFAPNDYNQLKKINTEGTANIVNLCISYSIQKLCYVSSVATMGFDPHKICEETPWRSEEIKNVYALTKYAAEKEVWRGIQEGVPSVIVNPGVILGPGYFNSGSGLLFKIINKGLKYKTNGITGYVDVKDLVKSMLLLINEKHLNERYIIVGKTLSFSELTSKISKVLGVKAPSKFIKKWMLSLAWRLDWIKHKVLGKKRKLTKNICKTLNSKNYYSSEKFLKLEKGFDFKPISQTISEVGNLFLKEEKVS
jgi:nucleoside-diphosphate-sugar epimerase